MSDKNKMKMIINCWTLGEGTERAIFNMYCGAPSLWNFRAGDIERALSINFLESDEKMTDTIFRRDIIQQFTGYR